MISIESKDAKATLDRLRTYADLPFVFLCSAEQAPFILDLLGRLKAIRSTCYPHALFVAGPASPTLDPQTLALEIIPISGSELAALPQLIKDWAQSHFAIKPQKLSLLNPAPLPQQVDVCIVGAGVTGLYAAQQIKSKGLSFCVVDKRAVVGGIWSLYANTTSQVNSSEGAYRLIEQSYRTNRDHSMTREILEDIAALANESRDQLFLNTTVEKISKNDAGYEVVLRREGHTHHLSAKGVILAINDRVGDPRSIQWENQKQFQGRILNGFSDETLGLDWRGKRVVVVGMGAFAIENARTALEAGAKQVTVVCRRHGTVCPKIIDYLNFATPYDDEFKHANKSNMRNMLLWKNLYKRSGATEPECWMGKIKHTGHTISVSDIWFVGHYLKKLKTVKGDITSLYEQGVIVNGNQRIEADVVINCVGFLRNAPLVQALCGYSETYNVNYLDKDFMYLADAYIDDDAFNSFFGSSVLEMAKFYLEVFLRFFNQPEFNAMIQTAGIYKLPIAERAWSHYIAGANALINAYPEIRKAAWQQVEHRTQNFLEAHDLPTYIAANKREWLDMHSAVAGRPMREEECLPYVFEKLLEEK
ncbi:MAG: FAD-dependent oxidoreductase [Desulfobacteraceae bacterium]|nr:FAD-dependent oxidoreductase [Desulfobacteraceae bacterium]